jgi:hypothetical protein
MFLNIFNNLFKGTTLLETHTGENNNAQRDHSKFANDKPQRRKPLARIHAHTDTSTWNTHTHRKTQNSKHQKRTKATTGPNNTNKHRARGGWKLVLDNVLSDVFKPQFGVADSCCQWHFAAPARGLPLFCLGLCLHLGLLLLH